MRVLPEYLSALFGLFFPAVCAACGAGLMGQEKELCLSCINGLPYTQFHLDPGNAMAKQFWGKIAMAHASACFYFTKHSRVQHLLHEIKYKGRKNAAHYVGELYGHQLRASGVLLPFDAIVPVPIFSGSKPVRGYNQAAFFANGLSSALHIPVAESLIERQGQKSSQTHKSRAERFDNLKNDFIGSPVLTTSLVSGKHYLIADDVVTTGATIEICAGLLLEKGCAMISVVSIAFSETR